MLFQGASAWYIHGSWKGSFQSMPMRLTTCQDDRWTGQHPGLESRSWRLEPRGPVGLTRCWHGEHEETMANPTKNRPHLGFYELRSARMWEKEGKAQTSYIVVQWDSFLLRLPHYGVFVGHDRSQFVRSSKQSTCATKTSDLLSLHVRIGSRFPFYAAKYKAINVGRRPELGMLQDDFPLWMVVLCGYCNTCWVSKEKRALWFVWKKAIRLSQNPVVNHNCPC